MIARLTPGIRVHSWMKRIGIAPVPPLGEDDLLDAELFQPRKGGLPLG